METMMTGGTTPDQGDLVFFRQQSPGLSANWLLAGGIGAFALAAFGFVACQFTRSGQLNMQLMTTVPVLIGIAAIAKSRAMARTPRRVTVNRQGLSVESDRGIRSWTWRDIGWSSVTTAGTSRHRQLMIYDLRGKTLTKFGEGIEHFDALIELISSIIDNRGDGTAKTIQQQKGRRSSLFIGAVSLVMAALAIFTLREALENRRTERLINEASVQGEAEILRRFVAPNGITHRLEYRVRTPNGPSKTRNAEVTESYWNSLEQQTTVRVEFVPAEPNINRLLEGEVESTGLGDSPGVHIAVSCALMVLCALFLLAAVMQWFGWDVDLDSKTGKISIKRFGTGR